MGMMPSNQSNRLSEIIRKRAKLRKLSLNLDQLMQAGQGRYGAIRTLHVGNLKHRDHSPLLSDSADPETLGLEGV